MSPFLLSDADQNLLFDGNALLPRERFEGLQQSRPPYGNWLWNDHPAPVSPTGQVVTYGYQSGRGSGHAQVYLYDTAERRFEPVPRGEFGKTRVGDVVWSEAFGAFLFATHDGIFAVTVEHGKARIAPPMARLGGGRYELTDIHELGVVLLGFDQSTFPVKLDDPMRFSP